MRRLRYSVVASLDGYITGPNGEIDWIVMDPSSDFNELLKQFDTLFVGRRTFDTMAAIGQTRMPGMETFVFSRTLRQGDHPDVTIVGGDAQGFVESMRSKPGKDIWLMGGGSLFRSLADMGLVDTVEVAVMPVVLGGGIPLVPQGDKIKLELTKERVYTTGAVALEYAIRR